MNEGMDDGGGSAGVVDTLEVKLFEVPPKPLEYRERESGVEGGLDEKGTVKPDILMVLIRPGFHLAARNVKYCSLTPIILHSCKRMRVEGSYFADFELV